MTLNEHGNLTNDDKLYRIKAVRERIELLQKRYKMYCVGVNEDGKELTYSTAAGFRHTTKKDIGILMLIEELLAAYKGPLTLSEQAEAAIDMLTEPNERHRNNKE